MARILIALIAIVPLAGCGGQAVEDPVATETVSLELRPWSGPISDSGGVLTIAAPAGYAERGATKKSVDWVSSFEESTNCKVNVVNFAKSDQAVQLVKDGGYDVVAVPSDATGRLVATNQMQPINVSLLANHENVVPALRNAPWNTFEGIVYGVSDGRGANLLQYNTKVFGKTPDTWELTWQTPDRYRGKVSVLDTPMHLADAAIYLMKTNPELGITDPYSLDQVQFTAARDLVLQQRGAVGEYWSDYAAQLEKYRDRDLVIGDGWQVTANLAKARKLPVAVTKPAEGASGWSMTWMLPSTATNLNCAYKWLDWVISAETNAQIAEWVGQAPANLDACAVTDDPAHCQQFRARDADFWQNVYVWRTPQTQCQDGRSDVECVPYDEWQRVWFELRSLG